MYFNKKSQSFSTDIIVVIVLILFGSLFFVTYQINSTNANVETIDDKFSAANSEANIVIENLKNKNIIDSENEVDVEKLLTINEQNLREELGLSKEFAIVFEKDGKLVKIDPENNINCIGSKNIVVNGVECK